MTYDQIAQQERERIEREERAKAAAQALRPSPAPVAVEQPAAPVTRITPAVTADLIRERIVGALDHLGEADLRKVWDFVQTMKEAA